MIRFTRDRDQITISSATALVLAITKNIEIVISQRCAFCVETTKLYIPYFVVPVSESLGVVLLTVVAAACNPFALADMNASMVRTATA